MGAGALSGHSTNNSTTDTCSQPLPRCNQTVVTSSTQPRMSCEVCSVHFTIFKRKKFCQECRRSFCSTCLPKPPSNSITGRQCNKCKLLMSGLFSRDDLQSWKVKDMTCFLNARNISTKDCREKHDLIELVLNQFCKRPRPSLQYKAEHEDLLKRMAAHVNNINSGDGPSTSTPPIEPLSAPLDPPLDLPPTDSGPRFEITAERLEELFRESVERFREVFIRPEVNVTRPEVSVTEEEESTISVRRTQIDDISSIDEIEDLTIRQLKELLVNNFVDYRGCCEKPELIERVKRLWRDHQANKAKAERIHRDDEQAYYGNQTGKVKSAELINQQTSESMADLNESMSTEESSQPAETKDSSNAASTAVSETAMATAAGKLSEDSLCHICMDALADCILLECGHMVTCTQCGKRLANCPICRQFIVRVVRVFRS